MIPWLKETYTDNGLDYLWMDDGASAHRALSTRDFFEKKLGGN